MFMHISSIYQFICHHLSISYLVSFYLYAAIIIKENEAISLRGMRGNEKVDLGRVGGKKGKGKKRCRYIFINNICLTNNKLYL